MDLSLIRKKLETLNNPSEQGTEKNDKLWTPPMGKSTVRIVPSAFDPANPFTELKFHQKISKYPIMALSNIGQQDPVEDFIKKLRETNNKENWSLSGKLTPRLRYFVPVIVRGRESEGVKFWSFGVTIYKALLQLAADEEIGDYTDIANGFDVKISRVDGNPFPETTITLSRTSSKLSENASQVEEWLSASHQGKPSDCFRKCDYDYIKKQLENYLTGGATNVEAPKSEENVEQKKENPAANTNVNVKPVSEFKVTVPETKPEPKSTMTKFEDLFGDGDPF